MTQNNNLGWTCPSCKRNLNPNLQYCPFCHQDHGGVQPSIKDLYRGDPNPSFPTSPYPLQEPFLYEPSRITVSQTFN